VLTAGKGEPLVFWHGAGTFTGFDFAKPWAEKFRVIIPFHPGFGESGDDPAMTDPHDYVMHYLDLFDALDLAKLRLVGFSLGGYLAAKFAMEHGHRVSKLVLVGPVGLCDQDHPTTDILALPPEQLLAMLASNFEVIRPHLPVKPDLDFIDGRHREMTTVARLLLEHPCDARLPRYLHRLTMPTSLVWGRRRSTHARGPVQALAAADPSRQDQHLQRCRPPRARRKTGSGESDRRISRVTVDAAARWLGFAASAGSKPALELHCSIGRCGGSRLRLVIMDREIERKKHVQYNAIQH